MASSSSTTREILKRYRAIIIAVGIFAICDIGVMTTNIYSSFRIAESAVSINLAGRQRMLSQRMTKALLSLQDDASRELPMTEDLQELGEVVYLFDTSLEGFREGKRVIGGAGSLVDLVKVDTLESARFVADTYVLWEPYEAVLEPLLKDVQRTEVNGKLKFTAAPAITFTAAQLDEAVQYARANNKKILALMNSLTTDLEITADTRAVRLRMIQIIGLLIAMFNVFYTLGKSISDLVRGEQALTKARQETQEILDTVREGLFLIDRNFRIGSQYSASLPNVLRRQVTGEQSFLDTLSTMVPDTVFASARDYIELLFGNRVKESLVSDLNPLDRIEVLGLSGRKHYLNFNFNRVFENDDVTHLLVTVQDVTDVVHLSEALEASKGQARREVEVMLDLLTKDPGSLVQFLNNTEQALAQINERMRNNDDSPQGKMHTVGFIMRVVHGIKGEAAALSIEMFEGYAHAFEQELSEMRDRGEVRGEDIVRISVLLEGFYERLSAISTVVKRMLRNDSQTVAAEEAPSALFETHLANLVRRICMDAQKSAELAVDVRALDTLPRRIINELQSLSIQLVRNAVKHGIEYPKDRAQAGKLESGTINVACRDMGNGMFEFTVRDDGQGISVEKIRQTLIAKGEMSEAQARAMPAQEVIMHIFKSGFSTSAEADRDAGRGVGLEVVTEKVIQLHGNLTLNSKAGVFTEFRITFEV